MLFCPLETYSPDELIHFLIVLKADFLAWSEKGTLLEARVQEKALYLPAIDLPKSFVKLPGFVS